jgi:hypothetical protein
MNYLILALLSVAIVIVPWVTEDALKEWAKS